MKNALVGIVLAGMLALVVCGGDTTQQVEEERTKAIESADEVYNSEVATVEAEYTKQMEDVEKESFTDKGREMGKTIADEMRAQGIATATARKDERMEEAEEEALAGRAMVDEGAAKEYVRKLLEPLKREYEDGLACAEIHAVAFVRRGKIYERFYTEGDGMELRRAIDVAAKAYEKGEKGSREAHQEALQAYTDASAEWDKDHKKELDAIDAEVLDSIEDRIESEYSCAERTNLGWSYPEWWSDLE